MLEHQLGGIAERHAEDARLGERALSHEERVPPRLEDAAGERDGVAEAAHAGHRAVGEPVTLHDGGVHLHRARAGEDGAASGVEAGVILEGSDRRFHRVERRAAGGEALPPRPRRLRHARAHLLAPGAGIGAGAAVDDEGGHSACHRSPPFGIIAP